MAYPWIGRSAATFKINMSSVPWRSSASPGVFSLCLGILDIIGDECLGCQGVLAHMPLMWSCGLLWGIDRGIVHVADEPQPNCFAWRFLGVLRDLALNCVSAFTAKTQRTPRNPPSGNSFQEGKNFLVSSTVLNPSPKAPLARTASVPSLAKTLCAGYSQSRWTC